MSDTEIKGLKELQAALQTLPLKLETNVMRGAVRAGLKPVMEAAKENVHNVDGKLAASIRIGTRIRGAQVIGRLIAGGNKKGQAFYAEWVERGTAAHIIQARPPHKLLAIGYPWVQHPGAKPHPYLRPALDNNVVPAVNATADYIRTRLSSKYGIDVPEPTQEGDE